MRFKILIAVACLSACLSGELRGVDSPCSETRPCRAFLYCGAEGLCKPVPVEGVVPPLAVPDMGVDLASPEPSSDAALGPMAAPFSLPDASASFLTAPQDGAQPDAAGCGDGLKTCPGRDVCIPEAHCCVNEECGAYSNGVCNAEMGKCSYTVRLAPQTDNSGTCYSDGTCSTAPSLAGEDNNEARSNRYLLSFDRKALPDTMVVEKATLAIQISLCLNSPIANGHGDLLVEHLIYGRLNGTQYRAPSLGTAPPVIVVAVDDYAGWRTADITTWVQWEVDRTNGILQGSKVSQQRFRLAKDAISDGVTRRCGFFGATSPFGNAPYLDLKFRLP